MESSIHQSLRLLSLTHHFWFRKITISPILHRFIEWRTFHPQKNLSYPDFITCPLLLKQFYFIIKWVKWSKHLFFRIFRIFATFYNFTFYMKWRCYSIILNLNNRRVFMEIWYGVREMVVVVIWVRGRPPGKVTEIPPINGVGNFLFSRLLTYFYGNNYF